MKKKFKITIILLSAVLLFSCGVDEPDNNAALSDGNNEQNLGSADAQLEEKAEVGYLAPDFSVELLSGETVNLSDFRGKVVIINFWATWCGPCVRKLPGIQQISEVYADDAVVLAINCSEDKSKVEDFISENGYTFHVGPDYGPIQSLYPTQGIPYSIIVNADGVITQMNLGGGGDIFAAYEGYIKTAIESTQH
jgi:cytochrome c-type biogenesis protein